MQRRKRRGFTRSVVPVGIGWLRRVVGVMVASGRGVSRLPRACSSLSGDSPPTGPVAPCVKDGGGGGAEGRGAARRRSLTRGSGPTFQKPREREANEIGRSAPAPTPFGGGHSRRGLPLGATAGVDPSRSPLLLPSARALECA